MISKHFYCFCLIIALAASFEINQRNFTIDSDEDQYIILSALSYIPPMVVGSNETYVFLEEYTGSIRQLWKVKYGTEPGLFQIQTTASSGYYLANCVDNDSCDIENCVHFHTTNGTNLNEQWYIYADGHIVNALYAKPMAVYDPNQMDLRGHQLALTEYEDLQSQKFYLIKIK